MGKSIVYCSHSGFTKKYADLLSKETGLPAYSLKDASAKMNKNNDVIFLGWVMAGQIKGYKKAKKQFNLISVCAVGITATSKKIIGDLTAANSVCEPFFYLHGGYNLKELRFPHKQVLKMAVKMMEKETPGLGDFQDNVSKENLADVIRLAKM